MLVIHEETHALRETLRAARAMGRTIGFVPTMGALHAGHASLVEEARRRCDVVVASIFVNPLQFGPNEDLQRYPRTLEADRLLLESVGADHLWLPTSSALYPPGFATRVTMTGLTEVLCGRSRPTHFEGVLTVVYKLFQAVGPTLAVFGRKDYQQALVIRRMVADFELPIEIVTCPIVREPDGLALSSRNRYLTGEQRARSLALRRAVLAVDRAFREGVRSTRDLVSAGHSILGTHRDVRLDYLEIRDPHDLSELREARPGDLVAIAAHVGATRLIDNGILGDEL